MSDDTTVHEFVSADQHNVVAIYPRDGYAQHLCPTADESARIEIPLGEWSICPFCEVELQVTADWTVRG